ncbi:hypothetical protein CRENBAI_011462 [Crenichthys baileyi]|uniref:Uncharacterized protein n=1 Tax=Crenichthys baileyi TaxID=28760 RepID=A0AAV9R4S1_9TELE
MSISFSLERFLADPSPELIDGCRKCELLQIVEHFKLQVPKQVLKGDLKALIVDRLVCLESLICLRLLQCQPKRPYLWRTSKMVQEGSDQGKTPPLLVFSPSSLLPHLSLCQASVFLLISVSVSVTIEIFPKKFTIKFLL